MYELFVFLILYLSVPAFLFEILEAHEKQIQNDAVNNMCTHDPA